MISTFSELLPTRTDDSEPTISVEPPAIARARSYIAAHHHESLPLPDISRAVGMSPFHFCRSFRRATGQNYLDYLAAVRVETAKQLLGDPHRRIREAAFAAGFQSLSQFNRLFHRYTGHSPTAFRSHLVANTPAKAAP